jgi:endonuclease/exonuclease/phosphatase family metal-dependent hydrolase
MELITDASERRRESDHPGGAVRFMTFNIRFDTLADADAGNRWADRGSSVIETIRRFDPDIVGLQEALPGQLADLQETFVDYTIFGEPREAGDVGEYVPVLARRDRFEVEQHGDFWLSPTPEMRGSRGWDAGDPRHCTWVQVADRSSGQRAGVFNTHLDRWGALARLEASRLIVARAALTPDLPTVVMGDLNAPEDSEPLTTFRDAGLLDTFRQVHPDRADVQTAHHYTDLSGPSKIDFILCDSRWEVVSAEIIRAPAAGRLPSDHYPVVAVLRTA